MDMENEFDFESRIMTTSFTQADSDTDTSLRPKRLEDYIGQESAKANLRIYMEAAKMDGANFYQVYFKIMRSQASPLALTLGLLLFIAKWNDYMSPLLYMDKMPTLSSGLYRYQVVAESTGDFPVLYAGLFMCLLPILIIFSIFSDKMMNSLNVGGLKG